jgi:hypothetical protein
LGYLDDLIITPGGIWLAVRLIPPEVMEEARSAAATRGVDRSMGIVGAAVSILMWIVILTGAVYLFLSLHNPIANQGVGRGSKSG